MTLSIIVPSRWTHKNIIWILDSLNNQSYQKFELNLLIDSILTQQDYNLYIDLINKHATLIKEKVNLICNLNSDFESNHVVSYIRNYWVTNAKGNFIFMLDDDNKFDPRFLQKIVEYRESMKLRVGKDFLLWPTIMYRDSGKVVNQWFSSFNYYLSKPVLNYLWEKPYWYVDMYGWNSLYWPTHLFNKIGYDKRIDFVYEDLDFAYRATRSGIPILVARDLKIYHFEVDKTPLQHAFVWDERSAYRKAKHRFILVNNSGRLFQKYLFYIIWVPFQTTRLILKILLKWKEVNRISIIKAYIKWTLDGYRKNY